MTIIQPLLLVFAPDFGDLRVMGHDTLGDELGCRRIQLKDQSVEAHILLFGGFFCFHTQRGELKHLSPLPLVLLFPRSASLICHHGIDSIVESASRRA